jgi:hypothetical protein
MSWSSKLKGLNIPVNIQRGLGLTLESDEMDYFSSGYNYRTFPKTWIFRDQDGWRWKKVGNSVFSFCSHHGRVPEGTRELRTWLGDGKTLVLVCEVEHATINNHQLLDESYQKSYDGDAVSTVCGRSRLRLLEGRVEHK